MIPRPHYVTLAKGPEVSGDADGYWEPLVPAGDYIAIQPLSPAGEGRTVQSLVTMRYRDDVVLDTKITFGTRTLLVRGMQHVDERRQELRLLCEEAI